MSNNLHTIIGRLFEDTPFGVVTVPTGEGPVAISTSAREMLGMEAGTSDRDIVATMNALCPGPEAPEVRVGQLDGGMRTLRIFRRETGSDDEAATVYLIEDNTTCSRQTNESRKLAEAIEMSPVSVMITSVGGNIEQVNKKFEQVTGYTREEVIGRNPRFLKSGEMSTAGYREMWKTLLAGNEWRGEFHNRKKNGELYWELASINALRDSEGIITHFLAVKEDITQRKQIEEDLRKANLTKDHLFTLIEHDLKNAFNSLITISGMLNAEIRAGEWDDIAESSQMIEEASTQAYRMLTNLLHWAHSQTGTLSVRRETVDLSELILQNITILQQQVMDKQIALEPDYPTPAPVCGDAVLLNVVVGNILSNAIKYSYPGGEIRISYLVIEAGGSQKIRMSFTDSGIGLTAGEIADLHRIDYIPRRKGTANEEGSGLGLIVCREFLGKMDGTLLVWSPGPGLGCEVSFVLPLRKSQAEADLSC